MRTAFKIPTYALIFFIRIYFIRILRLRFATGIFEKLRKTCFLAKQTTKPERVDQEKQFKHEIRGRVAGESSKSSFEVKNI